jgi:hypothetical protein
MLIKPTVLSTIRVLLPLDRAKVAKQVEKENRRRVKRTNPQRASATKTVVLAPVANAPATQPLFPSTPPVMPDDKRACPGIAAALFPSGL